MAIDIEAPGGDEAALKAALGVLVGIECVRITVTSAQLLALNVTPKTLVAAPGAGKMVKVIDAIFLLDFGTTEYAGDGAPFLGYDSGSTIVDSVPINDSEDTVYFFSPALGGSEVPSGNARSDSENKAVILTSDDPITTGDSDLIVEILYRIIDWP